MSRSNAGILSRAEPIMTPTIELVRHYETDCTIGELTAAGLRLFTIERAWKNNEPNRSCIPEGIYTAIWTRSPRLGKWTYEITRVAGRAGIRIHAGNVAEDSLGCPLLGMRRGVLGGKTAVLLSREAVARFNSFGKGLPLTIEIKSVVARDFKGGHHV